MGGDPDTLYGFQKYCESYLEGYGDIVDRYAGLIVNEELHTNNELADKLKIPIALSTHILRLFENQDFVKLGSKMSSGRISIYEVTLKLRRALT